MGKYFRLMKIQRVDGRGIGMSGSVRRSVIVSGIFLAISHVAVASCITDLMTQSADKLVASVKGPATDHLWHGSGCYSDDPDEPGSCDWRTKISTDKRIAVDRRLLVFTSNHETGSGAWSYVRIYGCSGGKVKLLFADQFLYGVTIEQSSPRELVLVSGHWSDTDPECCPSARERYIIKWDPKKGRYRKPEVKLLPLKGK